MARAPGGIAEGGGRVWASGWNAPLVAIAES